MKGKENLFNSNFPPFSLSPHLKKKKITIIFRTSLSCSMYEMLFSRDKRHSLALNHLNKPLELQGWTFRYQFMLLHLLVEMHRVLYKMKITDNIQRYC